MTDGGFPLPEVIDPPTISFCIEIPDETWHIRAFWGAMWDLTRWFNWERDEAHRAIEVANVWHSLYWKNIENWRERECMDAECCAAIVAKLDEQNKLTSAILEMIKDGFYIKPIAGSLPSDYTVDCSPEFFDGDASDQTEDVPIREQALCLTVAMYITAVLYRLGKYARMNTGQKGDILALMPLDEPPDFYPELQPETIRAFTLEGLDEVTASESAFEDIVCEMVTAMDGQSNTFAKFTKVLTINPDDENNARFLLRNWVYEFNQNRATYNVFARTLETNFEALKVDNAPEYDCPCEPVVPEYPMLIAINPVDSKDSVPTALDAILTEVDRGTGLWRFEQPTIEPTKGRYIIQFKDQYDRCIDIQPSGGATPTQGVHEHWGVDCDDIVFQTVGDFAGGTKEIGFDYGDAVDTYYLITLVP